MSGKTYSTRKLFITFWAFITIQSLLKKNINLSLSINDFRYGASSMIIFIGQQSHAVILNKIKDLHSKLTLCSTLIMLELPSNKVTGYGLGNQGYKQSR
jgi:hypothetical protein